MMTIGEMALRGRMARQLVLLSDAQLDDTAARMLAYKNMGGSDEIFRSGDADALRVERVRRQLFPAKKEA